MLEQLITLVQQNAGETILQNPAVPEQYKNAAVMEVARQIFGGFQSQMNGGNLAALATMLQGSGSWPTCHPTVRQIIRSVSSSLNSKFGVSVQASQQISSSLLPCVLSKFVLVNWLGRCSTHNFLTRYYLI